MSYREALLALQSRGFKTLATSLGRALIAAELRHLDGEGADVAVIYGKRKAAILAAGPTPAVEVIATAPRPRPRPRS